MILVVYTLNNERPVASKFGVVPSPTGYAMTLRVSRFPVCASLAKPAYRLARHGPLDYRHGLGFPMTDDGCAGA